MAIVGSIRILASAWESYERSVLPPDAGAVQRIESRRAFYAGASVVLGSLAAASGDVPEEVGVRIIRSLTVECARFKERVGIDT